MGFSAFGGQAAALRAGSCCPGVSVLDRKPQSGPTKYPLSACIVPVGWAVRWGSFRTKSVHKLVNRGVNLVRPWVYECVCACLGDGEGAWLGSVWPQDKVFVITVTQKMHEAASCFSVCLKRNIPGVNFAPTRTEHKRRRREKPLRKWGFCSGKAP